jgi:MFS family permease
VRRTGDHLGRRFGWLWAAYAVSVTGTWLAFDAFPLVAVLVLDAGPTAVSLLAASGLAASALVAVPLGPWIERRPKRAVMMATDLLRFAALLTVPLAYALGGLTLAQLIVVAMVVGAADIAFTAASGAFLKTLLPREHLLTANSRFEATMWTATAAGPPLGGAAIAVLGPVTTIVLNAASFALSALGIRAIGGPGPRPASASPSPSQPAQPGSTGDLLAGWRHILGHPVLRPLFLNQVAVGALIMATAPLLAVLMLGELGFPPWQYGLAFALPCLGGLAGARLARPLAARHGRERVLRASGTLRVVWPVGLAFVSPGLPGLLLVVGLQTGLVTCMGVFTPLYATERLERTGHDLVARTLAAWSVSSKLAIAATTALWGLLAAAAGLRQAIAAAGLLLFLTPLLLPRPVSSAAPSTAVR